MWIYEEQGVQHFHISPHDAIPVMIQGVQGTQGIDFDAVRDADENLQLQPEVLEWLEATPGQYTLRINPDFIEVQIADPTVASAFKMRWYGSYKIIDILGVLDPEHSIVASSSWQLEIEKAAALRDMMRGRDVVFLVDDTMAGVNLTESLFDHGIDVEIRRDVLVVEDGLPSLTRLLCERIVKTEFVRGSEHENGHYRQFEKRRRDGSYKRGRR